MTAVCSGVVRVKRHSEDEDDLWGEVEPITEASPPPQAGATATVAAAAAAPTDAAEAKQLQLQLHSTVQALESAAATPQPTGYGGYGSRRGRNARQRHEGQPFDFHRLRFVRNQTPPRHSTQHCSQTNRSPLAYWNSQ